MKQRTTAKTIRIPNDTIDDIAKTAKEKHSSFSKEVNRRLKGRDNNTNYPLFLAKTQDIINLCLEGVRTGNEETLKKAQEEGKKLWKETLTFSK